MDECGALNEWLAVSPRATPVCSQLGAMINVADFADRPPRGLDPGETLSTGRHRYRFVPTPHLPHGWDAGVLFDEPPSEGRRPGVDAQDDHPATSANTSSGISKFAVTRWTSSRSSRSSTSRSA